jgi:hypothetical protein
MVSMAAARLIAERLLSESNNWKSRPQAVVRQVVKPPLDALYALPDACCEKDSTTKSTNARTRAAS